MTDLELAEEIERKLGNMAEDFRWAITFSSSKWQQIIAALRRGHEPEVCPRCKGSGEAKGMTYGHGPDDYEIDVPCPECNGTGERPPSGEMVPVPRELIDRALLWFHTLAENGMDATFSDGERTPNAVAMDDIAAQFSALKDRA